MRILMINRSTHYSSPGGDTVQVESTAEFLRKNGVKVNIAIGPDPVDYSKYDLLHFFNIIRPANILAHIHRCNKPFVVSPIFVDYSEYERMVRSGISRFIFKYLSADMIEYLKIIMRRLKNSEPVGSKRYLFQGQVRSIKHIINRTAMLLPNSENEYNRLLKRYHIHAKHCPIPNAINSEIFNSKVSPNNEFLNTVICVARIEGIKNQLHLIKALNNSELKLFIIGKPSKNYSHYFQECKRTAGKNVKFIPHVSQSDLAGIYKAARVHALPSWFETTGLSSLEAAAMGCNIVISRKGDQVEYFKNNAIYCKPDDVDSIRNSVFAAYKSAGNISFQNEIAENYTWERTAQKTLESYVSILR